MEGENLEDILENHEERLREDDDGDGGLELRSSESVRFRAAGAGMGMGVDCAAAVGSAWLWVSVESGRRRELEAVEVAVVADVAVVAVATGSVPIGWRGSDDSFGSFFGREEVAECFGALSIARQMALVFRHRLTSGAHTGEWSRI